jgi:hypothetical protein
MDTDATYCAALLEAVQQAGEDPELAYLVRTRLRRALVGLERGVNDHTGSSGPLEKAPSTIRDLVLGLRVQVERLCQPSECIDTPWRLGWDAVMRDIAALRAWVLSVPSGSSLAGPQ